MANHPPRIKLLLNGTWQLQPSKDEELPVSWEHSVPVPALVDSAVPRFDWKEFKYHWHRTTFSIAHKTDLSFIVIEQAMFGTEVWLNGQRLGGDIACYTSQEYDTRKALREKNDLVIRVGQRGHLPSLSAVGQDQERTDWIPGIWGDVSLIQCGNPRVRLVQVLPHIDRSLAEVRVTVENYAHERKSLVLSSRVLEKRSREQRSELVEAELTITGKGTFAFFLNIAGMQLWEPGNPFLYEVETCVMVNGDCVDAVQTTFGMREFKVEGRNFMLNGKQIFLRGSNIAFHRFLSDPDRSTLPWDPAWVKKLLVDIPREHNFNFFRNHIGQMYNRWYDIADEHGMLLQNEWMFWKTTGTKEQITKEFTRWLQDNWNHPSIVIWDALNECSDDTVQKEIVPEMKRLDPTRPWESVDFIEEHPYIYSLGMVLNDRRLGFTRSLDAIEHSSKPTMLNEFCWWWLDKEFNPSLLTKDVVERWLGPQWTKEQLIAHQSFLVQELVELFRRMRVDAIQPFVYLSNNTGPTANWFAGDIRELRPKPILAALKNAFAPFGVSVELWDRHFFCNEIRSVNVHVMNDQPVSKEGSLRIGIVNDRGDWVFEIRQSILVNASGKVVVPFGVVMPSRGGEYRIRAELTDDGVCVAYSEKIAHVFDRVDLPPLLKEKQFALHGVDDELIAYSGKLGIRSRQFVNADMKQYDAIIVGDVRASNYQARLGMMTRFLESGRTIVLIEPEFGIEEEERVSVALGVELLLTKREDIDKGGYDSYVFADDGTHPVWRGLSPEHLKMLNGGFGGEMVSEHTVSVNREVGILARCGMHLAIPALMEVIVGGGRLIISRIQTRGRLTGDGNPGLFARREDPVAQRYLLNLLTYAAEP